MRRRARRTVLRLAAGDGCARLLREDVSRGALLLERLGRSLHALRLPTRRRLRDILVSAAARIWRPAPDCGLPTGTAKARWLAEFITTTWAELDRPCSERAIEDSLACARRRGDAHRDETAVLVHGDVHQWNALAAADGFRAAWTPTASSPNLNTTSASSCAKTRSRATCGRGHATSQARAGLDPNAIWEWGVVERVSTGLLATGVGLQPLADRCRGRDSAGGATLAAATLNDVRGRASPAGAEVRPPAGARTPCDRRIGLCGASSSRSAWTESPGAEVCSD